MTSVLRWFLCGLAWSGLLRAELFFQLQAPTTARQLGEPLELHLLALNPAAVATSFTAPATLSLAPNNGAPALLLHTPEPRLTEVAAGGFARVAYRGTFAETPGAAQLVVFTGQGPAGELRVVLSGATTPAATEPGRTTPQANPSPDTTGTEPPRPKASATRTLRQLGFHAHEPIYIAAGFNDFTNLRFQLSFKFRFVGREIPEDEDTNLWDDVYFTYTQNSIWDIASESKPFFDSNYRPGFVYELNRSLPFLGGRLRLIASPLEHESNGQGGAATRSLNIAFVRPELTWRWGEERNPWFVRLAPKLYTYWEKSENANITDYRGYGDYRVTFGAEQGGQLSTLVRVGDGGRGSVLMDYTYPTANLPFMQSLNGYGLLQWFNGYGETLRTYQHLDPWQIRVGYMIIR